MIVAVRSFAFVPPKRWLIHMDSGRETLGQELRRLRLGRGLLQKEVAKEIGLTAEKQSLLSRYERDLVLHPNFGLLDKLADFYSVERESLALAAYRLSQGRPVIPPNSVAIPNEPELIEAVEALFLLEPEDIPRVTQVIREVASPALPRQASEDAAAG